MKKFALGLLMAVIIATPSVSLAATKNKDVNCSTSKKELAALEKKADKIESKYENLIKKAKKAKKDYSSIYSKQISLEADVAIEQMAAQRIYSTCMGVYLTPSTTSYNSYPSPYSYSTYSPYTTSSYSSTYGTYGLSNNNYYTNTSGYTVHSPAYSVSAPSNASAQCRDGTYSFSMSRSGTCSSHGGVSTWY